MFALKVISIFAFVTTTFSSPIDDILCIVDPDCHPIHCFDWNGTCANNQIYLNNSDWCYPVILDIEFRGWCENRCCENITTTTTSSTTTTTSSTTITSTPTTTSSTTTNQPDSDDGLSGGEIAGIVIGSVFGLLLIILIIFLIFYYCCK